MTEKILKFIFIISFTCCSCASGYIIGWISCAYETNKKLERIGSSTEKLGNLLKETEVVSKTIEKNRVKVVVPKLKDTIK